MTYSNTIPTAEGSDFDLSNSTQSPWYGGDNSPKSRLRKTAGVKVASSLTLLGKSKQGVTKHIAKPYYYTSLDIEKIFISSRFISVSYISKKLNTTPEKISDTMKTDKSYKKSQLLSIGRGDVYYKNTPSNKILELWASMRYLAHLRFN
jgi:hypothetical protein